MKKRGWLFPLAMVCIVSLAASCTRSESEPFTVIIPAERLDREELAFSPGQRTPVERLVTVSAWVDEVRCQTIDLRTERDASGAAVFVLGLKGQPEECGREGATVRFTVRDSDDPLFQSFTLQRGATVETLNLFPAPAHTGLEDLDPRVQATVSRILARDVEGLLQFVAMVPVGCVPTPLGPGTPPTCTPGLPQGTLIPTFMGSVCHGYYVAEPDEILRTIRHGLAGDLTLYAIVRIPEGYVVATSLGPTASPTAPGRLFHLDLNGRLTHIAFTCANYAAQALTLAAPDAEFILGPLGSCSPPPGHRVSIRISVESLGGGGNIWDLTGPAFDLDDPARTEYAIVQLRGPVQWLEGPVTHESQMRVGMTFTVQGVRLEDCAVLAATMQSVP